MSSPRFTTRSGFTTSFIRATNARARAGASAVSLRSFPFQRASGPKCRSLTSANVRSTGRAASARLRAAEAWRGPEVAGRALPLRRSERAQGERVEARLEFLAQRLVDPAV